MVLFTLLSVPEKSYPVGSCMAQRGGGRGWSEEGVYSLTWPNIRVLTAQSNVNFPKVSLLPREYRNRAVYCANTDNIFPT